MEKTKRGPGDIRQLVWPENVLCNPEYMIGSLTPEPSGKPCEGACNAFREIIDNAIDVTYDNPEASTIIVDTENFNGYNLVADDSWGIPIKMSEVPGKTMAHLSISSLNSGSKFTTSKESDVASIGRHGVGSSVSCALSERYVLMSKITQDNYNTSIPAVQELWESQGPRSKKDLFYVVVYENYGNLAFEGAMKLSELNEKLGVTLPSGMSTMVLFRLGTQYVPDPRVVIPYDNLNYFLLIMKEFYKRKVTVIANGKSMTATDLNMYRFKIIKTIIPEDTSKNKEVKALIYFDVDPELSSKSSCGSVNGLVVNTGLHLNYVEASFEQALKNEYKITHRYTMNGYKACVIILADAIGFDSQTKVRLKSIAKVKQSDFTGALSKEFQKIFRSDPEYWEAHVGRLNFLAESMKSLTAAEKAQKMIDDAQGRNMLKSKAELIPGFSDATEVKDRWSCELYLTEGLSSSGSLKSGRHSTQYHAILPLRGKILNVEGKSMDQALDNKEIFTIFRVIGLGIGENNVTNDCQSPEEAFEKLKRYSRFGKIIIATDEDSDGLAITKLLLYLFGKFGKFLIDFGMVYRICSPIFEQNGNKFYSGDPIQPGTTFPIGLDPSKPFHRYKGLGAFNKDQIYDIFYNPATRKLVQITPEGFDYSMKLSEDINERKKLLYDSGIISNPYGFTDL